jgi:hypothetical protein
LCDYFNDSEQGCLDWSEGSVRNNEKGDTHERNSTNPYALRKVAHFWRQRIGRKVKRIAVRDLDLIKKLVEDIGGRTIIQAAWLKTTRSGGDQARHRDLLPSLA